MSTQSIVCLVHSLLIDGIAASLAQRPGMRLAKVDPDEGKVTRIVKSLHPDFLIYQLGTLRSEQLLCLLNDYPDMQLVGIHPEYDHLIVLSERQHCFVSMQDLIALLEDSDRQACQAAKGGNQIDMKSDRESLYAGPNI